MTRKLTSRTLHNKINVLSFYCRSWYCKAVSVGQSLAVLFSLFTRWSNAGVPGKDLMELNITKKLALDKPWLAWYNTYENSQFRK